MEEKTTESEIGAMATSYQKFDPEFYLQNFCSPKPEDLYRKGSNVALKLECLHRAFNEGDMSGGQLVDIGSGPTVYQIMSACEIFNKVILTDFLEVNRQELRLWLKNEGGSKKDWTTYLQQVCKLEGRRPSEWTDKAARLRQVVKDVLHVDVHRPRPLQDHNVLPSAGADCVLSCFCLEAACSDLAGYKKALGHIGTLLRSGGHLLLMGAMEEDFYLVGPEAKIPVVPLSESLVCDSLKENGFTLIRLEVFTKPPLLKTETNNSTGSFFVKAIKN